MKKKSEGDVVGDMKHNKVFSANFLSWKIKVKEKQVKNTFSIFDCEYYYKAWWQIVIDENFMWT